MGSPGLQSTHGWDLTPLPGFSPVAPTVAHFYSSVCCHQGTGRWMAGLDSGHEEWGAVGRAGGPRLRAGPGVRPGAAPGLPKTEVLLHCGCRRARDQQGEPRRVSFSPPSHPLQL